MLPKILIKCELQCKDIYQIKHANQLAPTCPSLKAHVIAMYTPTLSAFSKLPVWTASCAAN